MSDRDPLLVPGGIKRLAPTEPDGPRTPQLRRLYEQCDRYRTQDPPAEHPAASITYLGYAAANLALAYQVSDQPAYLDEARRWIAAAVSYPHWGKAHLPDHDLDAGWLCFGLGLAYDWLREALPPAEAAALRDKLLLQGRRLYEYAVETKGRWWSSAYWQNHNWICHTGLATAGYALSTADTGEAGETAAWTERARANFTEVFARLPADGSDAEGVVYWRYGVPWLACYAEVLRGAEDVDLFAGCDFLRNTFWYRLYQAAPNLEEIIPHGDCHDRRSGHSVALYYKLAAEYGIGEAQWLARQVAERFFWREAHESGVRPGVMPEAFLELLWYDPEIRPRPPAHLPTHRYFPDLGLVVARSGWDADATMLSFKASPGGGHTAWEQSHRLDAEKGWQTLSTGHHHPDAGSFALASHGALLAVDEGYCNRKRAAHHNLVLVDGRGFAGEDRYDVYRDLPYHHQAHVLHHAAGHGLVLAVADTTAMYPADLELERMRRTVVFTPAGTVVVHDDLAATTPRTWSWLLHSDNAAEPVDDRTHLVRHGTAQLAVTRFAPADAAAVVTSTDVYANPTASTPSLEIRRTMRTLRWDSAPRRQETFLTVLQAGRARTGPARHALPDGSRPRELPAAAGRVVAVPEDGADGLIAVGDATGRISAEGLRADAHALALYARHGHVLLGVIGGRFVEVAGVAVLTAESPTDLVVRWTPDGAGKSVRPPGVRLGDRPRVKAAIGAMR